GIKSIDISADFRLKDASEYEKWYGVAHPKPSLLEESVYGLSELNRGEIRAATLIANPGCYPTAAILALAPAIKEGLIHEDIIIDAKSGVSGAGRGLSLTTHFSEVNENVSAYAVNGHRHLPEIIQELRRFGSGFEPRVTFLPHLIPMTRGILSSCYATLKDGAIASGPSGIEEVRALYKSFYRDEPFVQVVDSSPMTKHTLGNNNCIVYPTVDLRTNRLMVISCLDNLVKGAAGQAIQNMNIMLDLPETEGLEQLALYP
ncbi:MAG: N-acetyl-gamma-glutamyl-phosphate reductase, partial [Chloroflexota bacterium]